MGATTPLGRVELFELCSRHLDHGTLQGPRYGTSEHRETNLLQAERAKKILPFKRGKRRAKLSLDRFLETNETVMRGHKEKRHQTCRLLTRVRSVSC